MIKLKQVVIIEGKYDKIKLQSLLDAVMIPTNGFSIFHDKEKLALIRRLAEKNGAVIATDSDSAGFQIRSFLKSYLKGCEVYHLYIPDVLGKERRKAAPSKEGKLGVEGISPALLLEALKKSGITEQERPDGGICKADLFELGLSGCAGSAELRRDLCHRLGLPARLSSNALLDVLNLVMTREALYEAVQQLKIK